MHAGDIPHHGRCVDLYQSNDKGGFFEFFNSRFAVSTALPACPLFWRKWGAASDMMKVV